MIKVRLTSGTPKQSKDAGFNWYKFWRRHAKNFDSYTWNNIKIVKPNEPSDLILVINYPYSKTTIDKHKAIIYQLEPKVIRQHFWGEYNEPSISQGFLFCHNISTNHMCIDWNVEHTYQELQNKTFKKTKLLSTIQTYKDYCPGHKLRKVFLQQYLDNLDYIDIYGHLKQGIDYTYKRYKGKLPVRKKESALDPYKYSFCCENSQEKNYWTEKLVDALVCECLPFYWGCPNLYDFLPKDCCIELPLENPKKSLYIIEKSIANNEYEKRLPIIREAKKLIMEKWQVFSDLEYHLTKLGIL